MAVMANVKGSGRNRVSGKNLKTSSGDIIVQKAYGFHLKGGIPSVIEAGVDYKKTTIKLDDFRKKI